MIVNFLIEPPPVADYNEHQNKTTTGVSKKGWSMITYKETVTAKTSYTLRNEGDFMNKETSLAHEKERGTVDRATAEARWTSWAADPQAARKLSCFKDGELQIEVEIKEGRKW